MSFAVSLLTTESNQEEQRKIAEALHQKMRDYTARENSQGDLRVQFRQHGDCTPEDPRMHIPNFDLTPKYVCLSFVNISQLYFNVLVHESMIMNRLPVTLKCTMFRTYLDAIVKNPPIDGGEVEESAEEYFQKLQSLQTNCMDNDMLRPGYMYVYAPIGGQKRGRDGKPVVRLRTERQQTKLQQQLMQNWECQQQLHSVHMKDRLVAGCQPKGKQTGSTETPVQRPTFIIEGEFGFDHGCPIVMDECCDGDSILIWNGMTYRV